MSVPEHIIIKPVITEKASTVRTGSVYVFAVDKAATKIDIRKAVEKLFKVTVIAVNTSKVKGKVRRLGKHEGKTASWKKAYVKIKSGQKIEMVEGMA